MTLIRTYPKVEVVKSMISLQLNPKNFMLSVQSAARAVFVTAVGYTVTFRGTAFSLCKTL